MQRRDRLSPDEAGDACRERQYIVCLYAIGGHTIYELGLTGLL